MKKVLTLASVLALAACGFSQEQIAQHDADFAGCERVDTSKTHLVYKCPANMERFAEVKAQEPTAMFMDGSALNFDEVNADKEHVYVEVVAKNDGDCKDGFHYRTMVKPVNGEEMYAVISCKPVAEQKAEEPKTEEVAK